MAVHKKFAFLTPYLRIEKQLKILKNAHFFSIFQIYSDFLKGSIGQNMRNIFLKCRRDPVPNICKKIGVKSSITAKVRAIFAIQCWLAAERPRDVTVGFGCIMVMHGQLFNDKPSNIMLFDHFLAILNVLNRLFFQTYVLDRISRCSENNMDANRLS